MKVERKRIHFIAVGGAAMHNLALELARKDFDISGSDDEIFEPSLSRLKSANLMPHEFGWFPEKITKDINAVILGMHASPDNPELIKAQKLGIKIYSYPEFLYEQTKNKKRVVIGGSHGKTTVTSMIMHVLRKSGIEFDYMVGAQIEGFDTMVSLNNNSEVAIFEGDEYLSSPIDRRPKFHLYKPHIALINGIAWDHINVFPTFKDYIVQFDKFINVIEPGGELHYNKNDREVIKLINRNKREDLTFKKFDTHKCNISKHCSELILENNQHLPVNFFGEHNMQNVSAAMNICVSLGISKPQFYNTISEFKGSAKRMQLLHKSDELSVYLDFAHAPSKVEATVKAVKQQYRNSKIVTILELHTFSSLNRQFIETYKGTLEPADYPIVYYNKQTIKHKKLPEISQKEIREAFGHKSLEVIDDISNLKELLNKYKEDLPGVYLFMTSGNFGGLSKDDLIKVCLK